MVVEIHRTHRLTHISSPLLTIAMLARRFRQTFVAAEAFLLSLFMLLRGEIRRLLLLNATLAIRATILTRYHNSTCFFLKMETAAWILVSDMATGVFLMSLILQDLPKVESWLILFLCLLLVIFGNFERVG